MPKAPPKFSSLDAKCVGRFTSCPNGSVAQIRWPLVWIEKWRFLARGEINNLDIPYLIDFATPIEMQLKRIDAGQTGNLEGYHHKGYIAGGAWWYRNSFTPARLSDDEIAIATCLESMARYLETGYSFYGLAEASQDHYQSILIDQAAKTGNPIESST
jgi:hypothetical protein